MLRLLTEQRGAPPSHKLMISVLLEVKEAERDIAIAALWEAGTAGITEEAAGLRAFFYELPDLDAFSRWNPEVREEPERDWKTETEAAWEPFPVGRRFWLAPEWRSDPAPVDRLRLTIYPGMACGTGAAPATQLCLQALEETNLSNAAVLDVGTGTGILASAARLLGAGAVVACDIDPEAAAIANRNLAGAASVFAGSLRACRTAAFDVVVANLNAVVLRELRGDIERVVRPGGAVIVGGFREWEQVLGTEVPERSWSRDGWVAQRLYLE